MKVVKIDATVMEVVVPALAVTGLRKEAHIFASPENLRVAHIETHEVVLHSRKYVSSSARLDFDGSLWTVGSIILHPVSRPRPTDAAREAFEALAIHVCTELQNSDKWSQMALHSETIGAKMMSTYARQEAAHLSDDVRKLMETAEQHDRIVELAGSSITAEEHKMVAALIKAGHQVPDAFQAAKALIQ